MSDLREQVAILDVDLELAGALSAEQLELARGHTQARVQRLPVGGWDAIGEYGEQTTWLGLLILEGFVARETSCEQETAIEVIGPGDLLRPWDHDGEYPLASITTRWRLLEPTLIALLDDEFAQRISAWPALTVAVIGRTGRRARWLAVRLIISQLRRIDARVFYLFWHLAERWGNPTPEGIVIPLRLTHAQIGELIGAQRPSVTTALSQLGGEQLVIRLPDGGWRIPSDTPDRLDEMLSR